MFNSSFKNVCVLIV